MTGGAGPTDAPPVAVQSVTGPVAVDDLGTTLFHEHLFTDNRRRASEPGPGDAEAEEIARSPLRTAYLGRLRHEPLLSRDNCVLDDVDLAIEETRRFHAAGGTTIVEQTSLGCGRDVAGLRRVSEATGLRIVAGAGYYMEAFHPPGLADRSVDEAAAALVHEVETGTAGVRAGLLGEIGISADFTAAERCALVAAARAQRATGVPLSVHLPGWHRHGHEVLDVVEAEGVDPAAVVLSHLNPSVDDRAYQRSLGRRGTWLSFDMVGIDWFYGHIGAQAPCDEEVARGIIGLAEEGLTGQLLVSCDTYLKMQLRRHGGYGYDHVPLRFLPRLERLGMPRSTCWSLVQENPAEVFRSAAQATGRDDGHAPSPPSVRGRGTQGAEGHPTAAG